MQMTKDLYWVKNQIVVLNVVGSNPTGHPSKSLKSLDFQGLFFVCGTHWASRGNEASTENHIILRPLPISQ